ncbi:TPA: hypothetical protein QIY66_004672 [Raoultella planticola]|nr:hypothetical protein [Raoultella planticola]
MISSGTSQEFSGCLCTIPFINDLLQGLLQADIALYDVETGFAAHNQRGYPRPHWARFYAQFDNLKAEA